MAHFIYLYAECRYADCHYAECHYAECRYAECRGANIFERVVKIFLTVLLNRSAEENSL